MANEMRVVQYGCDIQTADDGQTRVMLIRMVDYGKESEKPAEKHVIEFASLEDAERILSKARVKVWEAIRAADSKIPATPREAMTFLDHAYKHLMFGRGREGVSLDNLLRHPDFDAMDIINDLATQIAREN